MADFRYTVSSLNGQGAANGFIRNAKETQKKGHMRLNVLANRIFPNGAVPFAAALDHFQSTTNHVTLGNISPEALKMHVTAPLTIDSNEDPEHCLSKVWKYRDEFEATKLCDRFVDALSEHAECAPGVLDSVNWCLYEVMDNVFQHSHSQVGFAMMQIHPKTRWAAFAISDTGIGIHKSFVDGGVYRVDNAYEAIMKAVQEKVTSKPKNMGNGLFGLIRVVGIGKGILDIRSGRGWMHYEDMKMHGDHSVSLPLIDARDHQGTDIDWQIDLSRDVTIQQALGSKKHADLRLEQLEDEEGQHFVLVRDFEEGLGTRRSAEQIRNRLTNLIRQGAPSLVLDFDGVSVVSSSFADEVLGKLALRMGLLNFMATFRLKNMSQTVQAIVERAIQQRLAEGDSETPGLSSSA